LSQQQRSAALGWARSAIQIVLGDVNADANPDIIVLSVAAEIPGATDTFVFGPSQAGGAPTAVRAIDPSLAKFFRDVKGWLKNPQHYFDAVYAKAGALAIALAAASGLLVTETEDDDPATGPPL